MEKKELEQTISKELIKNDILPTMDFPIDKEIKIDIDPDDNDNNNNDNK